MSVRIRGKGDVVVNGVVALLKRMCGDTDAGMEWFEGLISGDREYKLDTIVPTHLPRASHFGTAKSHNGAVSARVASLLSA